jgi:hypothetical protein
VRSHEINQVVKARMRPYRIAHQFVQGLARCHRDDGRFGLAIDAASAADFEAASGVCTPLLLHGRLEDRDRPSHVLVLVEHRFVALPAATYRRLYPDRRWVTPRPAWWPR